MAPWFITRQWGKFKRRTWSWYDIIEYLLRYSWKCLEKWSCWNLSLDFGFGPWCISMLDRHSAISCSSRLGLTSIVAGSCLPRQIHYGYWTNPGIGRGVAEHWHRCWCSDFEGLVQSCFAVGNNDIWSLQKHYQNGRQPSMPAGLHVWWVEYWLEEQVSVCKWWCACPAHRKAAIWDGGTAHSCQGEDLWLNAFRA